MKTTTLTIIAFILFSCDQKSETSGSCVRVKLVKELCGQAVLKILDAAYFGKGQDWDDGNGVVHQHVFSTVLPCNMDGHLTDDSGVIQPGVEFQIQFTEVAGDDQCARCKALLDGPEKFSNIRLVNDCSGGVE